MASYISKAMFGDVHQVHEQREQTQNTLGAYHIPRLQLISVLCRRPGRNGGAKAERRESVFLSGGGVLLRRGIFLVSPKKNVYISNFGKVKNHLHVRIMQVPILRQLLLCNDLTIQPGWLTHTCVLLSIFLYQTYLEIPLYSFVSRFLIQLYQQFNRMMERGTKRICNSTIPDVA